MRNRLPLETELPFSLFMQKERIDNVHICIYQESTYGDEKRTSGLL